MQVIDFILSDTRIQIVIGLVLFAILIAVFLTYLEFRAKNKSNRRKLYAAKEYFIRKLLRSMKDKKTSREKLDILDRTAKEYFRGNFGTQQSDNYSSLENYFEDKKMMKPAYFSRGMFEAYYSMSELNDDVVNSMARVFVEIYRENEMGKMVPENALREKIEKIIYKEENKKRQGLFDFISIGTSKIFGFLFNKIGSFFSLFYSREKTIERDWAANFEDVEKENIIKNFEDEGQMRMKHALILREKEVAQRRLDELKKKKYLKEEEKKQINEFERFLRRKKEDHFIFYGQ